MTTEFPKDQGHQKAQVFTPARVVTVQDGVAWAPGEDDRVFYATEEFSAVVITSPTLGAQSAIRLPDHFPIGIVPGTTFTFTGNGTNLIVVM